MCAVLPRSPCRGNSPVPRGPPQGIPNADESVLVTVYAARDAVSRVRASSPWQLRQRFGVASRPRETAALPGPIAQRGWPRPLCNPRPGLSRPEPRPVCRHRLRAKGRLRLSLCKPIDRGMALPGPSQTIARAMAAAASRSRRRARGKRADRGGLTALSMMHDGEDTRSPDLLPAPS